MVAITGASGSGKSTIARALVDRSNANEALANACLISQDAYYRDLAHMSPLQREAVDFDRPEAVEFELLAMHIDKLRRGQAVQTPCYDFTRHIRRPDQTETLQPAPLVVLDGLLLGAWSEVDAISDVLVFVETPLEVCLQRRIARDGHDRGRSEDSVRDFWETRALPAFLDWSADTRSRADLVVQGTDATELVVGQILDALGD